MELCASLFIILAGISYAQELPPLKVSFDSSATRRAAIGANLTFICGVNRDLVYAMSNNVELVFQPALGGTEVILTQGGKLIEAEPALHNIKITFDEKGIYINFEIKSVRDKNEGALICRVRPSNENPSDEREDKLQIVVLRPMDVLYLKFDAFDAISKDHVEPIEIDAGTHTVVCTAEGSNPAPNNVNLYLHGVAVPNLESVTSEMVSDVKKFRTVTTGSVPLTVSNSNQVLECSATSEEGPSLSVKLPIKIKVYDPKIVCNDSEAHRGKMYPVLTCIVDYQGLKIKSFKYELGNNKEPVHDGKQNNDFVEVSKEQITESKARVILNLYKAQDWHFQTEFYIVVENEDGHMTRESVRLREIPGNKTNEISEKGSGDNSCSFLSASLVTLIFTIWCAHQLSL